MIGYACINCAFPCFGILFGFGHVICNLEFAVLSYYFALFINFFNFILYVSRHTVCRNLFVIPECEFTDTRIKLHVPVFLSYRSIDRLISIFICLIQSHTEMIIPAVIRLIRTVNCLPYNKSLQRPVLNLEGIRNIVHIFAIIHLRHILFQREYICFLQNHITFRRSDFI